MTQLVGVEIEYIGPVDRVTQKLYDMGYASRQSLSRYSATSMTEWLNKPDGSVNNRGNAFGYDDPRREFQGGECVTPPLDFTDPIAREKISTTVQMLQDLGCFPNDTTGIHVHVDAHDLTWKQVVAVAKVFYKFQDVIYRVASSGSTTIREGSRTYARPIGEQRMRAMAAATTVEQMQDAWYASNSYGRDQHSNQSRYCGINLHSFFYRGTIEFRVFNSSMNPERVQAYVAMCVALVEDARRGKSRSINKVFTIGGMHSGVTQAKNAFHRFQQVLRYEAGMSREDMSRLTKVWNDSVPQAHMFSAGS